MEQLILNLFQEHLSKYIIGFRKEQINANVFNGKGSMNDIELNCSIFNEHLRTITSMIEIQRIHISMVSFYISSYTNLKHMPIHIDIDHITIDLVESFYYESDPKKRKRIRQCTKSELQQCIRDGLVPNPNNSLSNNNSTTSTNKQYNLLDRIVDNVIIEIKSMTIQYQIYGCRIKTKRTYFDDPAIHNDDTTTISQQQQQQQESTGRKRSKQQRVYIQPPVLQIQLYNIRWVTMNEYGEEIETTTTRTKQQQHRNHHTSKHHSNNNKNSIFIYKLLEMDYHVALLVQNTSNNNNNDNVDNDTTTAATTTNGDASPKQPPQQQHTSTTSVPILSSLFDRSYSQRRLEHHIVDVSYNQNIVFDARKKIRIHVTVQRRIIDSEYMAFQFDMMIPLIEILFLKNNNDNNKTTTSGSNTSDTKDDSDSTTTTTAAPPISVLSTSQKLNAMVHFTTALQYCMRKDRTYIDPFKPVRDDTNSSSSCCSSSEIFDNKSSATSTMEVSATTNAIDSTVVAPTATSSGLAENDTIHDNDDEGNIDSIRNVEPDNNTSDTVPRSLLDLTLADGLSDDEDDDDDDDDDNDGEEYNNQNVDHDTDTDAKQKDDLANSSDTSNVPLKRSKSNLTNKDKSSNRVTIKKTIRKSNALSATDLGDMDVATTKPDQKPLLVLSNGIVIHDKFSVSCNVHEIYVVGQYNDISNKDNVHSNGEQIQRNIDSGELICKMNGIVVEAIWPHINQEKGGYLQFSLASFSLYEIYAHTVRPVFLGGHNNSSNINCVLTRTLPLQRQHNSNQKDNETLSIDRSERQQQSFPILEDRSIRPDPITIRQKPVDHFISSKITLSYSNKRDKNRSPDTSINNEKEEIVIFPEIGIDQTQILLDTHILSRLVRFALNMDNGGYDPKWWTGDYSKYVTKDILVNPDPTFMINDYLLDSKEKANKNISIPSSDLFQATIRLSNLFAYLPVAGNKSTKSYDIAFRVDKMTTKVSPELPQILMNNELPLDDAIAFPHDPSDNAFHLRRQSDRESLNNFRIQVSFQGFCVEAIPILPTNISPKLQWILCPTDFSVLVCVKSDVAPSDESIQDALPIFQLYSSIYVHHMDLNLDVDILASLAISAIHHFNIIQDLINAYKAELNVLKKTDVVPISLDEEKESVQCSNRSAVLLNYIDRIWKDGDLLTSANINVAKLNINVWRRHVPRRIPDTSVILAVSEVSPLLLLVKVCSTKLSFIVDFASSTVDPIQLVGKLIVSDVAMKVCDFPEMVKSDSYWMKVDDIPISIEQSSETPMKSIVSFGSEDKEAFRLRFQTSKDGNRKVSFSTDVSDGTLRIDMELISGVIMSIVETLSSPSDTSWLDSRLVSMSNLLFPRGTVGYMITLPFSSLFTSDTSGQSSLQALLESFSSKIEEISVDILLIRVDMKNIQVFISDKLAGNGSYRFHFPDSSIFLTYLTKDMTTAKFLEVFAKDQTTWLTLIGGNNIGLCNVANTRQSIYYVVDENENSVGQINEELVVDDFHISFTYSRSKVSLSISEDFSIKNKPKFLNLFVFMNSFLRQCQNLPTLTLKTARKDDYFSEANIKIGTADPGQHASVTSASTLTSLRRLAANMRERVNSMSSASKSYQESKEGEIARLRLMLFLKEKERLGLHALVSPEAAGWLRVGSTQRSGVRGSFSCNVCPYWVVLRRSMLLLYMSPGEHGIVNIVPLDGSSLHEVGGGKNKHELKRAFAVKEDNGTIHLILARSDTEYVAWISAINNVIDIKSKSDANNSDETILFKTENHFEDRTVQSTASGDNLSAQGRNLSRSIAKVVQVAKAKGQSVVSRGSMQARQNVNEQALDVETCEQPDVNSKGIANPRIQQLQSRLAGMGNVTKNRFGSALIAAKQKGKEVAQRRRQIGTDGTSLSTNESHTTTSTMPPLYTGDAWSCKMCTFSNKSSDRNCQICQFERIPFENVVTVNQRSEKNNADLSTYLGSVVERIEHKSAETPSPYTNQVSTMKGEDQSVISDIAYDDDANPFELESRVGIKEKLGSVVRRAKNIATEGQRFGKHASKQENQQDFISGTMNAQRLNNVSLHGTLKKPKYPFGEGAENIRELPMKRLEGVWTVKVDVNQDSQSTENVDDNASHEFIEANVSNLPLNPTNSYVECDSRDFRNNQSAPITGRGSDIESRPDSDDATSASLVTDVIFNIKVFNEDPASNTNCDAIELTRTLTEVTSLHVSLSEFISQVPLVSDNSSGSFVSGDALLDSVRTSGRLLAGLLDLQSFVGCLNESVSKYYAQVISEFLNALARAPLPINALAALSEFLKLPSTVTNNTRNDMGLHHGPGFQSFSTKPTDVTTSVILSDFSKIISILESEVTRANVLNTVKSRLSDVAHSSVSLYDGHFERFSTSLDQRDGFVTAINEIMVQRDEVEFQMVRSEILHQFEMDRQRQTIEELKATIEMMNKTQNRQQIIDKKSEISTDKKTGDDKPDNGFMNKASYDADTELLSLCQQLTSEISARTAAELEVIRLQESRKIEQNQVAGVQRLLESEVIQLKHQLQQTKLEMMQLKKDETMWRESFEKIVHFKNEQNEN